MVHFLDTHAHPCGRVFDPDRREVIRRAQERGARTMVIVVLAAQAITEIKDNAW